MINKFDEPKPPPCGVGDDEGGRRRSCGEHSTRNTYHSLSETFHFCAVMQNLMYSCRVVVTSAAVRCTLAGASCRATTEYAAQENHGGGLEEGEYWLSQPNREGS